VSHPHLLEQNADAIIFKRIANTLGTGILQTLRQPGILPAGSWRFNFLSAQWRAAYLVGIQPRMCLEYLTTTEWTGRD